MHVRQPARCSSLSVGNAVMHAELTENSVRFWRIAHGYRGRASRREHRIGRPRFGPRTYRDQGNAVWSARSCAGRIRELCREVGMASTLQLTDAFRAMSGYPFAVEASRRVIARDALDARAIQRIAECARVSELAAFRNWVGALVGTGLTRISWRVSRIACCYRGVSARVSGSHSRRSACLVTGARRST